MVSDVTVQCHSNPWNVGVTNIVYFQWRDLPCVQSEWQCQYMLCQYRCFSLEREWPFCCRPWGSTDSIHSTINSPLPAAAWPKVQWVVVAHGLLFLTRWFDCTAVSFVNSIPKNWTWIELLESGGQNMYVLCYCAGTGPIITVIGLHDCSVLL